jgi:glycosyltransferase involved in cell wall biosynthesis
VGAEGLGLTHGKEILLADSPEEFRAAILLCLQDPDKAEQMGQEARHYAETYYHTQGMYQQLIQFLSNPSTRANA